MYMFPVYINGKFVGTYMIQNLFHKFGNGDGDDHLYLACHWYVVERLEKEGFRVEVASTLHNPAIIEIWKGDKKIWETNDFVYYDSEFNKEDGEKVFNSLPEEVRKVLEKIANEGIRLSF